MYEAMSSQGPIASLFYVIVLIIGNYILLKLFLAILLSDFEELSHKSIEKPSVMSKKCIFNNSKKKYSTRSKTKAVN
jgi:hypothetical protein